MQIGSYVIANDLLGVVEQDSGDTYSVRDKDGVLRVIKKSVCNEVTSPHALACLLYNKVHKSMSHTK